MLVSSAKELISRVSVSRDSLLRSQRFSKWRDAPEQSGRFAVLYSCDSIVQDWKPASASSISSL